MQTFGQKWSKAIEYYLQAIGLINLHFHISRSFFFFFLEYFKAVQITLTEPSLISILQAQIVQCEKSIHLCQLKDRAEQVKSEELLE